jgi:hypothetical protein
MIKMTTRPRRVAQILGLAGFLLASTAASAQTSDDNVGPTTSTGADGNAADTDSGQTSPQHGGLLLDIEDYYTAPLHWDAKDWAYFGGAVAAVAAAHHYDSEVRTHFIREGSQPLGGSTHDLQDAIPTVAAITGTWLYANMIDSGPGHREAWEMVEAGGLSITTSIVFKFIAGRERPDQTSDPNEWRDSGSSFPSIHASAAFAVGAVLAESGNDDYRVVRRVLGYGAVACFTAFERLKHNAHWLSDDVAGAAIGGSTAHYILDRNKPASDETASGFSVAPIERGAMLTYNLVIK